MIRLTDAGIEDTLTGDTIGWSALTEVTASTTDHMTQRIPAVAFAALDGTVIEANEGSGGWQTVLAQLGSRVPLTVPDLDAAVSMLRVGQTLTVFRRG